MVSVELGSERLTDGAVVLRRPSAADVSELVQVVRSSLDELQPWLPWAVDDYDTQNAEYFLGRVRDGEEDAWLVRLADSDELVGIVGLNGFDDLNRTANLGYWARTETAGRGWITRGARLLAIYALEVRSLERIEIVLSVHNARSRGVAQRLGAHAEGVRRRALRLADRQQDAEVYALFPEDAPRLRTEAASSTDRA